MKEVLKWKDLIPSNTYKVSFNNQLAVVTCFTEDYTKPLFSEGFKDNIEVELIIPDNLGRDFIIKFDKDSSSVFDTFNLELF